MANEPVWPARIKIQGDPRTLKRFGAMVPAGYNHPNPTDMKSAIRGYLLVDPGAGVIGIDEDVATQLGLHVLEEGQMHGLHGRRSVNNYLGFLQLPIEDAEGRCIELGVRVELVGVRDIGKNHEADGFVGAEGQKARVIGILGRQFLQFTDLHYDGRTGIVEILIHEEITRPQRG